MCGWLLMCGAAIGLLVPLYRHQLNSSNECNIHMESQRRRRKKKRFASSFAAASIIHYLMSSFKQQNILFDHVCVCLCVFKQSFTPRFYLFHVTSSFNRHFVTSAHFVNPELSEIGCGCM